MTSSTSLSTTEISFLVPFLKQRLTSLRIKLIPLVTSEILEDMREEATTIAGILVKLAPPAEPVSEPQPAPLSFGYYVTLWLPGQPISYWNQGKSIWSQNRSDGTTYLTERTAQKRLSLLRRRNPDIRSYTEASFLTLNPSE